MFPFWYLKEERVWSLVLILNKLPEIHYMLLVSHRKKGTLKFSENVSALKFEICFTKENPSRGLLPMPCDIGEKTNLSIFILISYLKTGRDDSNWLPILDPGQPVFVQHPQSKRWVWNAPHWQPNGTGQKQI